jgi:hypothetical protein
MGGKVIPMLRPLHFVSPSPYKTNSGGMKMTSLSMARHLPRRWPDDIEAAERVVADSRCGLRTPRFSKLFALDFTLVTDT